MNIALDWLRRQDEELKRYVLREVMPEECRQAYLAGVLEVPGLSDFFKREISLPDIRFCAELPVHQVRPLALMGALLAEARKARHLCLPHFDRDLAAVLAGHGHRERQELLRQILTGFASAAPHTGLHVNVGSEWDQETLSVLHDMLELMGKGPTLTSPMLVYRLRQGYNLAETDPFFPETEATLALARDRQGISFALMDSPLNRQWVDSITYTGDGMRFEPFGSDLFSGTRGQSLGSLVGVQMSAVGSDRQELTKALALAVRLLALRFELLRDSGELSDGSFSSAVNVVGWRTASRKQAISDTAFLGEVASILANTARQYSQRPFLASVDTQGSYRSLQIRPGAFGLEAEQQHSLSGGHSLILAAGRHLSVSELHQTILACADAGLSFVRFSPEDIRCTSCHLPIAAPGPCPECGTTERRVVELIDGRLTSYVREATEHL